MAQIFRTPDIPWFIKLFLLFKRSHTSTDEGTYYNCTVRYKTLFGIRYVLEVQHIEVPTKGQNVLYIGSSVNKN